MQSVNHNRDAMLFLHVGWAREYRAVPDDQPEGKFSYIQEGNKDMGEASNFIPYDGICYGYAPSRGINLELLETGTTIVDYDEGFADNVTIVWTATHPLSRNRYIVGWYKSARVYNDLRDLRPDPNRRGIIAETAAKNAHLVPVHERTFFIPARIKNWPGTSSSFYVDRHLSEPDILLIVNYLNGQDSNGFEQINVQNGTDYPDEAGTATTYIEGAKLTVSVNRYERDRKARQCCLDAHGYDCSVCGQNFEKLYGEHGIDFIHVHHLKPLSAIAESYRVDPIKDLRPVCPNCHAMIHRGKDMLSIQQLKAMLRAPRSKISN